MHPQQDKRINVRLYFSAPKTVAGTTVVVQQMTLVEWVIWPPLTVSFWTNILEVCRATSTHCMVLSSVTVKEDHDGRGGYPEGRCCPPESLSALCQGPLVPPFLGLLTYGRWAKTELWHWTETIMFKYHNFLGFNLHKVVALSPHNPAFSSLNNICSQKLPGLSLWLKEACVWVIHRFPGLWTGPDHEDPLTLG